jgi:hypothetical protein
MDFKKPVSERVKKRFSPIECSRTTVMNTQEAWQQK